MTFIEPGLSVRNGFAEGPLADAALSRATRAGQLLDDLQEQAPTLTDGQLRDGVYRALRRFTREQPRTYQVDSITALIRPGCASTGWPPAVCPAPDTRRAGGRTPPASRCRWWLGGRPDERW